MIAKRVVIRIGVRVEVGGELREIERRGDIDGNIERKRCGPHGIQRLWCASRSPCSRVVWKPIVGQRSMAACRLYLFEARKTGFSSTSVASEAARSCSNLRRVASSG